ncbi:palmitoyltransferase ZDHHC23-B isoform X1 [Acipenser ruthenus]|uniref:palmitoyltransferase ZDHHC23-B isoform X1 n=3 Tax=Acipenser ruthenus TaxID=7906 RepID=UPI0027427E7C|nr:palmitoyltransferase ZDHHC23-B isoform X1 [Acipenser ruthenus]
MLSSEYGTVEVKTPCKSEGRWKQSGNKSPEIQTPVESQGIVRAMERAQMKRKALKLPETEESLCCCEYLDRNGEKNHIAACCCNCEDLDETCDRWCKCEPLNPDSLSRVAETLSDRFRLPWISGAQRVDITILPPLVLLPIFLHIAALHFLLALVILTALPVFVLWYYYVTHRRKGHTLFFLSLALFSLGYTYYLFLTKIVPMGDVSLLQLTVLTSGLILTLLCLAQAKKNPGYIENSKETGCDHSTAKYYHKQPQKDSKVGSNGVHHESVSNGFHPSKDNGGYTKPLVDSENVEKNWCRVCKIVRPPRAGHCRICVACVQRLDHHCVWINSCVGQANHRAFLLTLLLFLLTSTYGISLTLGSVCPRQSVFTALFYCPGVYDQYSSALCFTCCWYGCIVTGALLHLFIVQLINVSYNVTEREACIALREKSGRSQLWGLIVDTGHFNHGFLLNWREFLSMNTSVSLQHHLEDVV